MFQNPPAIVQNYTYHSFEQQTILNSFKSNHELGCKHYKKGDTSFWDSCVDAHNAYEQKETWKTWAEDLAEEVNLTDDTIRLRANAELMYRLGCEYDKPFSDALRTEKEYAYFRSAWKYRKPNRDETEEERVRGLLYHIQLSDSVRDLDKELKSLYSPLSVRDQLKVEMRICAKNLITLSGDDMVKKSTRAIMRFTAKKLQGWQ